MTIGGPCRYVRNPMCVAAVAAITGQALLLSRPVRFMGVISYPVYLIHGIVYYAAMLLRGGIHPVGAAAYIAETALCVAAILLLATALHLLVERPSMNLSEQIAHAASSRRHKAITE